MDLPITLVLCITLYKTIVCGNFIEVNNNTTRRMLVLIDEEKKTMAAKTMLY